MISGIELDAFGIEVKSPIWRVSSVRFEPMTSPPREMQGRSRFDDPMIERGSEQGGFSILYAGTDPKSTFLEVLFQYRRAVTDFQALASGMILDVSERDMLLGMGGTIPQDKLASSQLVSAGVRTIAPVFDLTNSSAVQALRLSLAPSLIALGVDDLDFGTVLSNNRQLTQGISRWLWSLTHDSGQPLFSGIRYRSRFDPECICLALYQDRYEIDGNIDIQPITPNTPGFAEAASILRLEVS